MVPEPEFDSYYGRQILKTPTWKSPDVPLYLFLGGLAGASAVLAEGAAATARPGLERVARLAAAGGAAAGSAALVHDLGRCGVSNGVWERAGPLSTDDWERVRLHAYLTERILARTPLPTSTTI